MGVFCLQISRFMIFLIFYPAIHPQLFQNFDLKGNSNSEIKNVLEKIRVRDTKYVPNAGSVGDDCEPGPTHWDKLYSGGKQS